jgi:tRNA A-37 threonylcarbamoyl transferase component Bud32
MQPRSVIGTVLNGRYRLESKLGSGGMSTVYLARDETLERWVAIKVLHREISDQPDQIERFRREARSVARLSHPNVVSVIDAGEDGGYPYIVFEYVEGETLKQRIERLGRLPLDEAAAYAIEIGRGLGTAHVHQLVHRDVKPQNVLIDSEGRAKVTDFGIARSLEGQRALTATGRVLGTTDYVSPEQAMGHGVDARSDIYSLGVVLYEMLTGDVPFHAETLVGVAMKHVNQAMPETEELRSEVSAALAAVIERATAKDPAERYPDMPAMLNDLEGALEVEVARSGGSGDEVTTVLESVPAPRRRVLTRRRVSWAGVLLVLAAAAAAVGIVVLTGEEQRASPGEPSPIGVELEADDFDPPPGDEYEHGDEVGLAVDGDGNTAWTTETYTTPDLGKPGVGIYVEAEKPVSADVIEIQSATPGWNTEIYGTASDPPDTLPGWGTPIGASRVAGQRESVPLETPGPLKYFLVWIKSPITSSASDEGGYRVEIGDIRLLD